MLSCRSFLDLTQTGCATDPSRARRPENIRIMDSTHDVVLAQVLAAIDDHNEVVPADDQLSKEPTATLYGQGGHLDSLGLVTLVTDIEERINDALDRSIALADERAVSQKRSPFRSIEALTAYAVGLLEAEA